MFHFRFPFPVSTPNADCQSPSLALRSFPVSRSSAKRRETPSSETRRRTRGPLQRVQRPRHSGSRSPIQIFPAPSFPRGAVPLLVPLVLCAPHLPPCRRWFDRWSDSARPLLGTMRVFTGGDALLTSLAPKQQHHSGTTRTVSLCSAKLGGSAPRPPPPPRDLRPAHRGAVSKHTVFTQTAIFFPAAEPATEKGHI